MINTVKYITLNFVRKYINLAKKNKIKVISGILLIAVFLSLSVDVYKEIDIKYYKFFPLTIFMYGMLKLFQEIPTMNISSQLIELKILKLWQLKLLVIVKSISLSLIIFIASIRMNAFSGELMFQQLVVSLVINIIVNLMCFLVYQVDYINSLKIVTILVCSVAYYFNSLVLISIILIGILVVFCSMNYLKYDLILPYYHSMGSIAEGLISGNMEGMAAGQAQLVKSKSESQFGLMEKHYGKEYVFFMAKEISRMLYYSKNWINLSLINFLAAFVVNMYSQKAWVSVIALLVMFFIVDNLLTLLNKPEAMNRNKGFYFPYSTMEILKQKYIVHLVIIVIPFMIPGMFLLKHISFLTLLVCYIYLPIKNILESFSVSKGVKWLSYLTDSLVLYIMFINIF